jgi:hypothetical protein
MKIERGEHMSYPPKFEDIEAWQLARDLARKVYCLTKKPRFARDYGLKWIYQLSQNERRKVANPEP